MKPGDDLQLVDGTKAVVRSEIMRKLMTMVARVARQDAAVLIVGETGSGKELVAQSVHQNSLRCAKPFVDVNCAALPEHLVESELFGYEKGAFSGAEAMKPGLFELADQGTLFLDEIGELDAKVQAKLLRVLDGVPYYRLGGHRKVAVQVRVIAATNRDLEEEVRAGKFRRDLYHRLTQFQLQVPPLRERPEDIVAIAEYFLLQQLPDGRFTSEAMELLQRYSWPGNVRELKNVVFRAAVQVKPGVTEVRASDLPPVICGMADSAAPLQFTGNLDDMERQMIIQAISQSGGSQIKAAQKLGISTRTLRRKLEKYRKEGIAGLGSSLGVLRKEQQRYFRVTLQLPATLNLDGQQIDAKIVNISSGGVAVECPFSLKHGTALDVTFKLPELESPIEAKAKLAWTSPGGLAGLSFAELHPAVERQLQQWLLEKAKTEGWVEAEPVG
ncbi:MAG TPA: sigma 54-interacting transcriptional regulator [Terriglobales bacterium]|nr:sigma 54-interacting transcriptional regulator [Terriglobales bacterium]